MRDRAERAAKTGNLAVWVQWIGIESVAQTECPGKLPTHFPGVLGIEIEVEETEWFVCRQWKSLGCCGCHSIDELQQRRVHHRRNCALFEVIVVQTKDSGVRAKSQFVGATAPGEVVVNEEARSSPAFYPSVVESANRSEGRICTTALQHDRKRRERPLKVPWPKQAFVPGEGGIEIVHQILGKDVRVARRDRVERLRGDRIEQGVDGISIGGLESIVRLKAEPGGIFLIDVVVDSNGLYLFVVVAGV